MVFAFASIISQPYRNEVCRADLYTQYQLAAHLCHHLAYIRIVDVNFIFCIILQSENDLCSLLFPLLQRIHHSVWNGSDGLRFPVRDS